MFVEQSRLLRVCQIKIKYRFKQFNKSNQKKFDFIIHMRNVSPGQRLQPLIVILPFLLTNADLKRGLLCNKMIFVHKKKYFIHLTDW